MEDVVGDILKGVHIQRHLLVGVTNNDELHIVKYIKDYLINILRMLSYHTTERHSGEEVD